MENQNEPIIFGVFDGQNMVTEDNKSYPVPSNYASKSRINEGDKLKLIIEYDGSLIYKQIGRQETKRLRAFILWHGNDCYALAGDKGYKIIHQTATYFHLKNGDEVVILVPVLNSNVTWVPVENVIKPAPENIKSL